MMLGDEEITRYLDPMTPDQCSSIVAMRNLIIAHAAELVENIDEGKWFGGLLTYSTPAGRFVFALGPRANGLTTFHMMPFYESQLLRDRNGQSLKKFLTGKSCMKFKKYVDLPELNLIDIIQNCWPTE